MTSLNARQQEAVQVNTGAALVLAGAGSGKTRVLTERFVRLIAEGHASPDSILAVTFTNKAAREMVQRIRSRLAKLQIPAPARLWVTTFHSCCMQILRSHAQLLGYSNGFTIYDDADSLGVIKKCLQRLNVDEKIFPAKAFKANIQNVKNLGLKAKDARTRQQMDKKSQHVYQLYEEHLKRANAMDFNDLLVKALQLFGQHPDVLQLYQEQFRYIMVDEYQDTNHIQYLLVKHLAQKHKNIFVVGDEDQSIYSWRGADISNILNFEKDFAPCRSIKLEQNYRSTRNIIQAASHMIQNNSQRHDKTLFSQAEKGDRIGVARCRDEYAEAQFVAKNIQHIIQQKASNYNELAVFYRTNAQSRALEEELQAQNLPYKIVGGVRFYARKEVKDLICYLRLALNPHDDAALKRVINTPLRGIGKASQENIENHAVDHGVSLYTASNQMLQSRQLSSALEKKVFGFLNFLHQSQAWAKERNLSQLYLSIVDATGYVNKLRQENTQESLARVENLDELHNAIIKFEDNYEGSHILNDFLEKMALLSEEDNVPQDNAVWLMTLHAAKGLEFDHVFMVGNEEGLFPGMQSLDDEAKIEEERRLFYVGMTRARKKLFVSHTRKRTLWGSTKMFSRSRFVDEIPVKFIQRMSLRHINAALGLEEEDKFAASSYSHASLAGLSSDCSSKSPGRAPVFPDYEMHEQHRNEASGASCGALYDLSQGQWVRHDRFGVGQVVHVQGYGDGQRVRVNFKSCPPKTFVSKFAKLKPLMQ